MTTKPEPDLFTSLLELLGALNTPTPDETKETEVTNVPEIDMQPMATLSWQMYTAFVEAGFSEKQAFDFTVEFVKHMVPVPGANA